MQMREGGVAFFDSGIGGLTVMATCRKYLPDETFYYLGDNARAPYGALPTERIQSYVFEAFEVFAKLQVKAAVVACNTATAVCVETLRQQYAFPIVGAEPAVFSAARKYNDILVLSTPATNDSARFHALCQRAKRRFPQTEIRAIPCPSLAGAIEKGIFQSATDYTAYLPKAAPAAVVLGCTHYIYIKEEIREFYGCEVYDGNEGIARRLRSLLEKNRDGQPPLTQDAKNPMQGSNVGKKKGSVLFLGSQETYNQSVFEQTFV